nr:hypothetical protein [Tanacetum cinerariifolium]
MKVKASKDRGVRSLGSRAPLTGEEFEAFEPIEAAALSPSSFCKRYGSSYETSSSSSLTLIVRKRYRGTSELILDIDSEGDELGDDDTEEDKSEGLGLEEEEVVPEAYAPPGAPVQIPPSLELSLGSLLVSPSSPVNLDTLPPTLVVNIDRDVRKLYTRPGVVRDMIFLHKYRFRSLKRKQERTFVTFGGLWRPMLVLDAWAGRSFTTELQEIRGRVTSLEQEKDSREQYIV